MTTADENALPAHVPAELLALREAAAAQLRATELAFVRAQGALTFVEQQIGARCQLGDHDFIEVDGTIRRASAPAVPAL